MPPDAEGESEEQPGHRADLPRHQLLCEDDDGRERGGQYQADDEGQYPGPHQIDVGQDHGEGGHSQNGRPNDALASDAVADVSAEQGAERHGEQKHEQMEAVRCAPTDEISR